MLEELDNTEFDNILNTEENIFNNKDIFNNTNINYKCLNGAGSFLSKNIPIDPSIPCFLKGTKILTLNGEMYVEDLTCSDILITDDNRMIKVQNIFKFILKEKNHSTLPYKISKDIVINNRKCSNDLYLSPLHQILVSNNLFTSIKYLPFSQIKANEIEEICYYHIVLPNYYTDTIIANGLACEGYGGYLMKGEKIIHYKKIEKHTHKGNTRKLISIKKFNIYKKIYNIPSTFLKLIQPTNKTKNRL